MMSKTLWDHWDDLCDMMMDSSSGFESHIPPDEISDIMEEFCNYLEGKIEYKDKEIKE